MSAFQAIFLGVIQGLTEFLPVSSSGHLIFVPKFLGWADQGVSFDVVMHLATLLAVVIYFRKKLWAIVESYFVEKENTTENRKLGYLILLSIIPAAVVGFFFGDWLENTFRLSLVVGFNMIFWGLVLYVADRYAYKSRDTQAYTLEKLNWKNSLFIGCAQVLALIPGTSRSGITITAGLFSKLDKKNAADFSFLMSVPTIALAGASGFLHMLDSVEIVNWSILSFGFVSAFVSGILAIWVLMKIIQKWSYSPFVVYRIILGLLILFLL